MARTQVTYRTFDNSSIKYEKSKQDLIFLALQGKQGFLKFLRFTISPVTGEYKPLQRNQNNLLQNEIETKEKLVEFHRGKISTVLTQLDGYISDV